MELVHTSRHLAMSPAGMATRLMYLDLMSIQVCLAIEALAATQKDPALEH